MTKKNTIHRTTAHYLNECMYVLNFINYMCVLNRLKYNKDYGKLITMTFTHKIIMHEIITIQ